VHVTKKKINRKVTKACTSRVCGETPSEGITIKFGIFGDLVAIINILKFRVDRSSGLGFTGSRKTYVPIGKASRP
jgi:hypothetical protein